MYLEVRLADKCTLSVAVNKSSIIVDYATEVFDHHKIQYEKKKTKNEKVALIVCLGATSDQYFIAVFSLCPT